MTLNTLIPIPTSIKHLYRKYPVQNLHFFIYFDLFVFLCASLLSLLTQVAQREGFEVKVQTVLAFSLTHKC